MRKWMLAFALTGGVCVGAKSADLTGLRSSEYLIENSIYDSELNKKRVKWVRQAKRNNFSNPTVVKIKQTGRRPTGAYVKK